MVINFLPNYLYHVVMNGYFMNFSQLSHEIAIQVHKVNKLKTSWPAILKYSLIIFKIFV